MSWDTCGSYRVRLRWSGLRWCSAPQLETHNICNSIWLWRWWAGLALRLALIPHFTFRWSDPRRHSNSASIERRHDGACSECVSRFARDRPRRPSPRLSILMQTRSLSTQRGYISHTKDVLSPDTTHTVSNVLIQSCFVSLSRSVWVLSGTGLEQWGIHTQTHT